MGDELERDDELEALAVDASARPQSKPVLSGDDAGLRQGTERDVEVPEPLRRRLDELQQQGGRKRQRS